MTQFSIPIRLPSLANARLPWWKVARLKREQREATTLCLLAGGQTIRASGLRITIVRVGPRKLDDDNLAAACKHVRDAIAAHITGKRVGIGDDRFEWVYEQRRGPYNVEVTIDGIARAEIKDGREG